uniref:Uncharacterized protein n=1 Tax=Chromera velia CCMP2878 TaxID=1169474 RepID=A0A0G4I406_9ALVE|eukprot:Cvel_10796.t1-p1 / transcript=Cvel_10796.t1 / gene=Cvel_10796 / organism=Chromera_velia_CCMP2878 / gene_product=hypothetical protein / transcript_product=hypothetical protein / location=Cvel_scaffold660:31985-32206(-) / protein_length=74 / sequence_SO=supercontig / SO=protein_coding / is_pseudo=false
MLCLMFTKSQTSLGTWMLRGRGIMLFLSLFFFRLCGGGGGGFSSADPSKTEVQAAADMLKEVLGLGPGDFLYQP